MGLRDTIAQRLFADTIQRAVNAAVSIRIDDSPGWTQIAGTTGPADRSWAERYEDLEDALEAWRKNFIVRRIVSLTRSYVVGNGITISSRRPEIDAFITRFWIHPQNRMDRRLGPMCDELTRAGEIFPILFTNPIDGLSYIRFMPAYRICEIECDPGDYEMELSYGEQMEDGSIRTWYSPNHALANQDLPPLMLHFAVNRPIGAVRGESDLSPVLPWARRYSEWLADRVRLNRQRTRQGIMDIALADDSLVRDKRQQLRTDNPIESGIYVHGPGEEVSFYNLNIDASQAEADGRVLRLAIAAGGNIALHYMGEGERTNYATARAMGEPTARHFTDRQRELCEMLQDLIAAAYARFCIATTTPIPTDLQLQTSVTEVAREDNEALARAADAVTRALAIMRANGWIDDDNAVRIAFAFAGEALSEEEIAQILAAAPPPIPTPASIARPEPGANNAEPV